jgi:hypothetical protein
MNPYRHVAIDPNDRRDQHSVPRSYLAAWCDPATPNGAYLWVCLKDRSARPRRLSPRRAFTVPDMNTLVKGGQRNLALESAYARIESAFGKVKDKIVSGVQPVDQDIEAIVCFVAAQMVRTSKFRAGWQLVRRDEGDQLASITDPELRSAIEAITATILANDTKLISFFSLPESIRRLRKMRLTLLRTNQQPGFITSDSPCCVVQYRDQLEIPLQCLESPTGNVLMPLSPTVLALFDHSPNEHQMIELFPDQPIAHEANALLWRGAVERVVLPGGMTRPEWFSQTVTTTLARYAVL